MSRCLSSRPSARLLSLLSLCACAGKAGGGEGGGGAGGVDSGAADTGGPSASVAWFIGTSDGQTADGSYVAPTEEVLFIRSLDPSASTMREEAWTVAGSGRVSAYTLDHTVDAAAETFSSTFDTGSGVLQVEGVYDAGEPWAWTAWHSRSVYQDGRYAGGWVDSVDTYDLDGTGEAHAEKGVFDPDGTLTYSIVEHLSPVSQATLEARLAELEAGS